MNVPNLLSLGRILLSGAMLLLLFAPFPYARTSALAVFGVAAATDALDGRLARSRYGVTATGALLDPLADKVMICCAFVGFVELRILPAWIVVLILSREFLVTGLRVLAAAAGRNVPAGSWGKHKTGWQIAVILFILAGLSWKHDWLAPGSRAAGIGAWFETAAWLAGFGAALVTVASGVVYFIEHRDLVAEGMAERGAGSGGRA